jgi:arsenate reductase
MNLIIQSIPKRLRPTLKGKQSTGLFSKRGCTGLLAGSKIIKIVKKILFVCVENSARSQMAEAFFNRMSKTARAESAGTRPASTVNPLAVRAMEEIGMDMSKAKPKMLTLEMLEDAEKVITMGCMVGDVCPAAIVETEDWGVEDPSGKSIEKFREVRDVIREKVEKLVRDLEKQNDS